MWQALKLVFSNRKYLVIAVIISIGLFVSLAIVSEYVFLKPYLVMHIPTDRIVGFSLISAISVLSGIVIAMNVYRIKMLHNKARKMGGGVIGSVIGVSAGACSCGPIGFAIISTFGTTAGIATAFLSNYEIPLRIVALAILGFTYYTTTKSLLLECKIKS